MRSYLPDPVPDAVLRRVLEAAHRAPSVGFMQPWTFLVVRDVEALSPVSRLLFDHLRSIEASEAPLAVAGT